jgi:hypothetical protein
VIGLALSQLEFNLLWLSLSEAERQAVVAWLRALRAPRSWRFGAERALVIGA